MMDYVGCAFASAIFGLIGGVVGLFITPELSGFAIGFLIVFAFFFFILAYATRDAHKTDERFARCDINKVWEESGYDKEKAVSELMKITELEESVCYGRLESSILGDIPKKALEEKEYNIEEAIEYTYQKTHFDRNVITEKVKKLKKEHEEEQRKKEEEKKRDEEIRKEAIYRSQVKSMSPKNQYKINKKNGIVSCPKCGSTQITTTNKKISVGKGIAGAAIGSLVNPVGTVVGGAVGATHSKKIYCVCMNCGHQWEPKK